MIGEETATIETAELLRHTAEALECPTVAVTSELRLLNAIKNAVDAAMSSRILELDQTRAHESEGASSAIGWARRELRMDACETRHLLRAAHTATALPDVGGAFRGGTLSARHLRWFTFGLKHVGFQETSAATGPLLDFARENEPTELGTLIRQLRDARCPDDLDARWVAGMDRRDIQLSPVMDGWHLTGFLPQEIGARFDALLRSYAVPAEADDQRTPAARRIDGFDQLLQQALSHGLPTDGTVAPQLHVTVDAGTLRAAIAPGEQYSPFEPKAPANLAGFGSIGPRLLSYLTCGSQLEPILIDHIGPNPKVLDVGRSQRLATPKQRSAIWLSQDGQCASPGCRHPISHVHHRRWYSHGGQTDLSNLVGLCGPCHRLIHAHRLAEP